MHTEGHMDMVSPGIDFSIHLLSTCYMYMHVPSALSYTWQLSVSNIVTVTSFLLTSEVVRLQSVLYVSAEVSYSIFPFNLLIKCLSSSVCTYFTCTCTISYYLHVPHTHNVWGITRPGECTHTQPFI